MYVGSEILQLHARAIDEHYLIIYCECLKLVASGTGSRKERNMTLLIFKDGGGDDYSKYYGYKGK